MVARRPPRRRLRDCSTDLALEVLIWLLEHGVSRCLVGVGGERNHSALMLAALIIGHQVSISRFCKSSSASGVCCSRGKTSCPISARRERIVGSAEAATIAALSLAITGDGVPLGAQMACQADIWNPGSPASSTVGTSGAAAMRVLASTAYALIAPARTCGREFGARSIMKSIFPATRSLIAAAAPR